MADAINKGFDRATGEWVMWLNGDDCLLPGALAKVWAFVEEHPEADVIHGDCRFVRSDRSLLRRKLDHPMDEAVLVFAGCWVPSTATFLKRRLLDAGHRLDRRFKNSMDWEFYLRLLRAGYRFCYLPEALADFRWHEGNLTLLHDARRRSEDHELQRAHLAARGWPEFLGWRPVLAMLRWVFRVRRLVLRWAAHRRLG
jgi:GT2 family glycosyltransferase